jgi:hypothetical protein
MITAGTKKIKKVDTSCITRSALRKVGLFILASILARPLPVIPNHIKIETAPPRNNPIADVARRMMSPLP